MKQVTFSGTIENAYGKPVNPPLTFSGNFDAYETHAEIVAAKDEPSNDDIVTIVNNKRKANARQKAMEAVLTANGYEKPTLESDVQLQLRGIVKSLLASGKYTEEKAIEMAENMLGAKYEA